MAWPVQRWQLGLVKSSLSGLVGREHLRWQERSRSSTFPKARIRGCTPCSAIFRGRWSPLRIKVIQLVLRSPWAAAVHFRSSSNHLQYRAWLIPTAWQLQTCCLVLIYLLTKAPTFPQSFPCRATDTFLSLSRALSGPARLIRTVTRVSLQIQTAQCVDIHRPGTRAG